MAITKWYDKVVTIASASNVHTSIDRSIFFFRIDFLGDCQQFQTENRKKTESGGIISILEDKGKFYSIQQLLSNCLYPVMLKRIKFDFLILWDTVVVKAMLLFFQIIINST